VNIFLEFSLAIFLALIVVLTHYETLRVTSLSLTELHIPPRPRILVVIIAAFFAHLAEVTLYAVSYMVLNEVFDAGALAGQHISGFYDYFYYSLVTYTTLGIGDLYPTEALRLLTGMESLVGLMMITWTASFTYLTMQNFWKLH